LIRILHFSKEYFVVVCVFVSWSPSRDTAGLAYGLETVLFLMFKKKKSI
jgi:hypothetical protein